MLKRKNVAIKTNNIRLSVTSSSAPTRTRNLMMKVTTTRTSRGLSPFSSQFRYLNLEHHYLKILWSDPFRPLLTSLPIKI